MRAALGCLLAVVLGGTIAAPAGAQSPAPGSEWNAWGGCWRLVAESGVVTPGVEPPQVCVAEVPGGARFTTTVGDRATLTQVVRTDGQEQPIAEGDCKGTQRAEWSRSGARLYSSATLTCPREASPRRISGYALLLRDGTWLDLQAINAGDHESVRVRRYRHIDTATNPAPTGRPLTLDDVQEASSRVSPAVLEAAIAESRSVLALSSKSLRQLDAAGVPDRVIDLMVAVAYPEKFIIERSRRDGTMLNSILYEDSFINYGMFGLPMWGSLGMYDPYWNPYHYSPFGYSYYGRYDPRFNDFGTVIVNGGGGGGGGTVGGGGSIQATGRGRVVDGQGYTRIRPRDAEAEAAAARASTAGATRSTSTSGPAPDSSSSSSSSGSSSSSASPAGYSGGSSGGGGDTGRTAVPR